MIEYEEALEKLRREYKPGAVLRIGWDRQNGPVEPQEYIYFGFREESKKPVLIHCDSYFKIQEAEHVSLDLKILGTILSIEDTKQSVVPNPNLRVKN